MSDTAGQAIVLFPGDARTIEVGGFEVLVHAGDEATGGAFTLIETVESAAGSGPPLHVHRGAEESFYVLEGRYVMHIDGRDFDCHAGSFVYIPRGTPHTFRVGDARSRKLNLYTPAAMEGYFDELGEALRTGVDDEGLSEIAARYAMDVLGPAPQGYLGAAKSDRS
jgi:mannose-6-phosphate isomerase-like protein (cupin superfamily)